MCAQDYDYDFNFLIYEADIILVYGSWYEFNYQSIDNVIGEIFRTNIFEKIKSTYQCNWERF